MSYDKQTWASGDVITAAKLNHMEDGIANSGGGEIILFYSDTNDDWHTNASYADVKYRLTNGGVAVACTAKAIKSSSSTGFYNPVWDMIYYEPYEDDILVSITSSEYLVWTENGITHVQS